MRVYACAYLPDVELLDALGVDPLHFSRLEKGCVCVYVYMYGGNVCEGVSRVLRKREMIG